MRIVKWRRNVFARQNVVNGLTSGALTSRASDFHGTHQEEMTIVRPDDGVSYHRGGRTSPRGLLQVRLRVHGERGADELRPSAPP